MPIVGRMDASLNPFRPGSGLRPPALVGRDRERELFDLVVAKSHRRTYDRGVILSGLRGVGKTTLLNSFADHAENHGWLVVRLEARPGESSSAIFRQQLSNALTYGGRKFTHRHELADKATATLASIARSLSVSIGPGGVTVTGNAANNQVSPNDARTLELDLMTAIEDTAVLAKQHNVSLGLFIDEMQDLDPQIAATLLSVQHRAAQGEWAFCLCGAGLPNLPAVLTDARSYAERQFQFRRIDALPEDAAAQALSEPITGYGCALTDDALNILLDASGGYPFFVQEFGSAIWDAAPDKLFTEDDAYAAVDVGTAALDAGFFPSRWDRATGREKAYLRAIADTGIDEPSSGAVANHMGSTTTGVSDVRQSTIEKGLVWAPGHGRVAFTVPGMADFIHRQPAE